jgi:hypothetical protein
LLGEVSAGSLEVAFGCYHTKRGQNGKVANGEAPAPNNIAGMFATPCQTRITCFTSLDDLRSSGLSERQTAFSAFCGFVFRQFPPSVSVLNDCNHNSPQVTPRHHGNTDTATCFDTEHHAAITRAQVISISIDVDQSTLTSVTSNTRSALGGMAGGEPAIP